MPQFSRRSVLAATDIIANWSHAEIDRFALKYGLENVTVGYSRLNKANALGAYLTRNPEGVDEDGANIGDSIVTEVVNLAAAACRGGYPQVFQIGEFRERHGDLHRALERDGFTLLDGVLRRTLPDAIDLPQADD